MAGDTAPTVPSVGAVTGREGGPRSTRGEIEGIVIGNNLGGFRVDAADSRVFNVDSFLAGGGGQRLRVENFNFAASYTTFFVTNGGDRIEGSPGPGRLAGEVD